MIWHQVYFLLQEREKGMQQRKMLFLMKLTQQILTELIISKMAEESGEQRQQAVSGVCCVLSTCHHFLQSIRSGARNKPFVSKK